MNKAWLPVVALCLVAACRSGDEAPLFELRSPRQSGIDFANNLQEDDSVFNPLAFDYLYNGAGVAVGDLNNDGRPDLYFAGNQVSSRLYLNRGDLRFDDVTEASGAGTRVWATGVTLVDIDQNGWMDIYVSVAGPGPEAGRANLLFVNLGAGPDGTPRFREEAAKWGLADKGYSTHAVFLDHDRDGDLDVYVLTNELQQVSRNMIRPRLVAGQAASTDRFYRNNGDGTFTDVSREAGITIEGYGLGVAAADLNGDGWPDVYVSNDFLTNDVVWINNRDGTFTNRAATYLRHQLHNGMGVDVADYNNDARPDIFSADMLPPDNRRQKMMFGRSGYDAFMMSLQQGYEPQFVRNALQLNMGPGPDGEPVFSEIGPMAGVHATDWSWAAFFADFDNDGLKDLFVSNGYRRDVTNMDFIAYTQLPVEATDPQARRRELYHEMRKLPEVRLHNYVFRNRGDLTFEDRSLAWGLDATSFSNGAAYADLDGDGDLDLVINNLDGPAALYENRAERLQGRHWLRVALRGPAGNRDGYGARVYVWHGATRQYQENFPYRGYKSTVEGPLHFGLGAAARADSVEVVWPDGRRERRAGVAAGQVLTLEHSAATPAPPPPAGPAAAPTLLQPAPDAGLALRHQETALTDFKVTPLLHRQYSKDGPGLAVGDVDGNGLDDVFVGADLENPRFIHLQVSPGRFAARRLDADSVREDMGALFFDADGDGHQDLYVVSGGSFPRTRGGFYQDRLYMNDGRGGLVRDTAALPAEDESGSSVVAADYDGDGDLDLFVGGRLVPGQYPTPARSLLLRNDSRPGAPRFTDVTDSVAPGLARVGVVNSALWTDFDGDGRVDLVLAGEWMPITLFRNTGRGFRNVTEAAGLARTHGWWNSLVSGDWDADGDVDFMAGNLGLNSRFQASAAEPVQLFARDFDGNGSMDPVLTYYLQGRSYPVAPRDNLIDQLVGMKGRFKRYTDYADATLGDMFRDEELEGATELRATQLRSSLVENLGDGRFRLRALPQRAQFAPVYGMLATDVNGDGALDALLAGNSYATETLFGWYDASLGTSLLGNTRGAFGVAEHTRTGFFVRGDAKAVAEVRVDGTRSLVLVTQNNDSLRVFAAAPAGRRNVPVQPLETHALVTLADGRTQRFELHHGSTYLSQSSRFLAVPAGARSVTVFDSRGGRRTVSP